MAVETKQNSVEPTEKELEPHRSNILVTALNSRLKFGQPLVLSVPSDLNPDNYPFLASSVHINGSTTLRFTNIEVLVRYLLVRDQLELKTLEETKKRL